MKTSRWFNISRVPVNITRTLVAVALVSLVAAVLHAALTGTIPLPPGNTVVPGFVPFPSYLMNTFVALKLVNVIPPSRDYEVTFRTLVEREPSGGLDFTYAVINSPLSTDSISRLTVSGWSPFQTSVGIGDFNCATGVSPVSADRDNSGNVVGVQFNPGKIAPGGCGSVVISTNATRFTIGNASLIDGGAAMVSSFLPTSGTTPLYRYDFYIKGTTNVGASFLSSGFVRDWSPASVPMPGFTGFVYPSHYALTPCDLTSNSSGELDCRGSYTGLDGNQINGVFYFVFNYGGFPRQLGPFTGGGYVRPGLLGSPDSSVVALQDGQVTQVSP